MRDRMSTTKHIAILAITVGLVVIGILNLRDRLSLPPVADDGIEWIDTPEGVQAKSVSSDSPLAYAVRKGDYVKAFFYVGKYDDRAKSTTHSLDYEEVTRAETLARYLETQGVGNNARYAILHPDPVLKKIYGIRGRPYYDVDFVVVARDQHLERGLYLAFIALVYLAIGLFVFFRQSRAKLTYHFFAWFLLSFVVYFYHSTREFTKLDEIVFLLSGVALALLAPVFLHFCAKFPVGKAWSMRSRLIVALLYAPAIALTVLNILWVYSPGVFKSESLIPVRNFLDRAELVHYFLFFLAGSVLLVRTFVRADRPLLKQQLKWIIWGIGLSAVPFASFYLIPDLLNLEATPVMQVLAFGPLILIPLSFGYSIIRYRLMDVDVIMRRSFVHATASIAVAAIYMAVLLGVGDLVKFIWKTADLNSWRTRVIVVAGMLIVTMLFAPIKNKLQVWADRWFYGERYTLRTGLQDFGRMMAQTTALPNLLDSVVRWLSEVLSVRKVAIFVEDLDSPSGFRLAHSLGLDREVELPQNVKDVIRSRSMGRGFVSIQDLETARTGQFAAVREFVETGVHGAAGMRAGLEVGQDDEFAGEQPAGEL